jgi:hypothetical protein
METREVVIQLEAGETISSIRDRLASYRGAKVCLVWPEHGAVLNRRIDLVLLQREARRRAQRIALVTHNPDTLRHARDLNISVFPTVEDAQSARWMRSGSRIFVRRSHRPTNEPGPEELQPAVSALRKASAPRRRALGTLFVFLAVIISVFAFGVVVLPYAEVDIVSEQAIIGITLDLTASQDFQEVDVESAAIPATTMRVTVETVGSVPTSGLRSLPGKAEHGVVTFTNASNASVEVPTGTTVSTSAGEPLLFRTTESIQVPAGGQSDATIEALRPAESQGEFVQAGMINSIVGPLSGTLTVRNISPTIPAGNTQEQYVLEEDLQRLERIVQGQLQSQAYEEMQKQLTPTQRIVIETIRIPTTGQRVDWTRFSHKAGESAAIVTLELRAVVEALAIDDRYAQQVVFSRLTGEKGPNTTMLAESLVYSRGMVTGVDPNTAQVTFQATATGRTIQPLDANALSQQLAGLPMEEAMELLIERTAYEEGTLPSIRAYPALPMMPLLPSRIVIRQQP